MVSNMLISLLAALTVFQFFTLATIVLERGEGTESFFPKNPADHEAWADALEEDRSNVSRRWYSVKQVPGDDPHAGSERKKTFSPWPSSCTDTTDPYGPGERWLRYCFKDRSSQMELEDVVMHAIAMWAPAFMYSSLKVILRRAHWHEAFPGVQLMLG
ncbi:hypothetical protein LTR37_009253 [Vermiconidia calcicola]|uniref:Uncharacterized protein n=1 Tax=Vermiconidia calcicola TaxID=1690605 RepID=A0ACC3N8N5_9PEZI|nr:hypothetical protein LTR37_009253 [Vermiconidia calcicola]